MKNSLLLAAATISCPIIIKMLYRMISMHLVKIAMDRNEPKSFRKRVDKITGKSENLGITKMISDAQNKLENAVSKTITIKSKDNLKLVGHWKENPDEKRVIIAMHGWRSCWARDFGLIADFLYENGCSILFAEQRAQGQSGGAHIGFGMLERHDCDCWIDWVVKKNKCCDIYLVGLSMGATTVLMTAGMDLPDQVRGIIADCGFTSAYEIWKHVAENNMHICFRRYASIANKMCVKKIRIGAKDYSTLDALRECTVPIMLVHGTSDTFVPIEMTYENYMACSCFKKLFIVPGAEHAMSYLVDTKGYQNAILEFWEECDSK